MRFKRSDLPGLLIAVLGPVALYVLLVDSYQLWHHHGSPILGIISAHIAIGGGLIGAFSRFIKARDAVLGMLLALILCVVGVMALQAADSDGTVLASGLKLLGVVLFVALNVVVVFQLLSHGLNPILQRRDDARAAQNEG